MTKKTILFLLSVACCLQVFSQAGTGVYQFLDLPISSRLAALGSKNISLNDNDINFAFQNPALLTAETNNVIGINIANYLADIQFGSAVYGHTYGKNNYFAIGIQYVDYGSFMGYDEINDSTGAFAAKDYAISLVYARPLTKYISVGATLKPIYSSYERYTSYGMAMDFGASYNNPQKLVSAGLVFRNIGTQFKGYYSEDGEEHLEPLPFDIQLGISKKILHAPLRLSLTLDNLQKWDLSYNSTNQSTTTSTDVSFVDMAFRHTIIAVEFVPSNNFYLTAAFNHRRQVEMSVSDFKSSAGFSFGAGVKIYKFHVGFGMTPFQVGNYSYQFSFSTSLNEFRL